MSDLSDILDSLDHETVYVFTAQYPTLKRTTTGKYVSHDLTTVVTLDEKGRFRNVPIDKIIRINYYKEGRSPF